MRKRAPDVACPQCGKTINRQALQRHRRSDRCPGRPPVVPAVCRHGIAWPCDVCWCVELFEVGCSPEDVATRTGLPLVRAKAYLRGHYGFQLAKRLFWAPPELRAQWLRQIADRITARTIEDEIRRRTSL